MPTAEEIRVELRATGPFQSAGFKLDRERLAVAYGARGFEPIWAARPDMVAALMGTLRNAKREGLDPEAFDFGRLKTALAGDDLTPLDRELLLGDRFLAYGQVMAQGRVAPGSLEQDWLLVRPDFDAAGAFAALTQSGDVSAALQGLLPTSLDYDRLRLAAQTYNALADAGGWPTIEADHKIEPGQKGDLVQALRKRLAVEGDLPDAEREGDAYDAAVTAAVKRFQTRHGLLVDGRVGASTLKELNVSAADRVEQIQISLERWREISRNPPATRIVVNIPAAMLIFYRNGAPELRSRVVVGAPEHPTPVLAASIVSVLFNPPWNVPASIIKKEIQPRLARDPGYLARNHYMIIGRAGGDPYGGDVDWKTSDLLRRGWRLRQEPGPWNALGSVKFELPNSEDIYLHDTPSRPLFARSMRALSHGCVRVEAVRPLAMTLLGDHWPTEAVNQAIADGETHRVSVKTPIPVYLVYFTAFVDEDGTVEFRDDVYGRDSRMATALADLEMRRRVVSAQTEWGEMIPGELGGSPWPVYDRGQLRSSIMTRVGGGPM
jgi:murein L,D-transpeptidase YcbB/YkuD